ncbi:glycosyltransferase [Glaciihabitans sp. dw_435]|uniref:glycosyltransferase n=1 Tax=Glaciihabitans sp. dw_435 TaxID=2720081 RepID=UPI001BD62108|nr:glycosyltransferase [Glaciihabitans sp. dw_435]
MSEATTSSSGASTTLPDATHPAYRALLLQRLRAVAPVLRTDGTPLTNDPAVSPLLQDLSERVAAHPGDGRLWLLFVAVAGAYPTTGELEFLRRRLAVTDPADAMRVVLEETQAAATKSGDWDRPLRLVQGGIVVDVNFCAKYVHNTGIQRVVRELMPHLIARAGDANATLDLVAWTRQSGITRSLSAVERQRVTDWRALAAGTSALPDEQPDELVVPWNSQLLLPEVPEPELCDRLAALAEHSGNTISLVGYDTIPISSADLVTPRESERFAHYLTVVKHSARVLAISESVAEEFRGFTATLPSQGLVGPAVHTVSLAADVPSAANEDAAAEPSALPLIICVGSHEPRKNQDAVLFAVETLLAEGLKFRAVFIGGGSRSVTLSFDRHLMKLRNTRGWDIESARGLKDRELWSLYRQARFSVLTSLHEGYGLPVVESLALGTPVLTSNYGSLAEIGVHGGCVLVNPRDDGEIIAAMRTMLTDDSELATLLAQIETLPPRTWRDYAVDLWDAAELEVAQ